MVPIPAGRGHYKSTLKAILQEEKLAAADRQDEDTATGTGGAAAVEPADGGSDGAAAAMLQRALDCLSQARDLLDEAEEEVGLQRRLCCSLLPLTLSVG